MKKFICAVSLLMFANTGFSQECKETVDPITNEKKVLFSFNDAGGFGNIEFENVKGAVTLTKPISYSNAINTIVPPGTEFFFKLENGEILKLKTKNESQPKVSASAYGVITWYSFAFALTKEDLSKLASSPLTFMRVPKITEEGFYDLDEKQRMVKKTKKPLMKGAACIGL